MAGFRRPKHARNATPPAELAGERGRWLLGFDCELARLDLKWLRRLNLKWLDLPRALVGQIVGRIPAISKLPDQTSARDGCSIRRIEASTALMTIVV